MQSDALELAFRHFLESRTYDDAESALFSMIRSAFISGWNAAGGEVPEPHGNWTDLLHKSQSQN